MKFFRRRRQPGPPHAERAFLSIQDTSTLTSLPREDQAPKDRRGLILIGLVLYTAALLAALGGLR